MAIFGAIQSNDKVGGSRGNVRAKKRGEYLGGITGSEELCRRLALRDRWPTPHRLPAPLHDALLTEGNLPVPPAPSRSLGQLIPELVRLTLAHLGNLGVVICQGIGE